MLKVSDVLKNGICAGCGLCAQSANEIKIDGDGFARPIQSIDDDISNKNCPSIDVFHNNTEAEYNPLWGPIVSVEKGFSSNKKIRHNSSSGGVLTGLAIYLLDTKKVDAVIQVGVSTEDPTKNRTYINHDPQSVIKCAGSRYSPSSPLEVIRGLLGNGKKYAVIGKPCDISALRSLIVKFPDYSKQFPYLLSFMCAGIPSEKGTEEVLKKLGVDKEKLSAFRYRGHGWPGLTTATDDNKNEYSMTYNESWGTILNRHLQARCKLCADGIGESADIVCGDAWQTADNGYPSFDEQEGYSLVLSRTKLGRELLNEAILASKIELKAMDIDVLKDIQPYQRNRKMTNLARTWAVRVSLGMTPRYHGYQLRNLAMSNGVKLNLKAFIGTLVRKIQRRL